MQKMNGKKLNGTNAAAAETCVSGVYVNVGCGSSMRWLPLTSANSNAKTGAVAQKGTQSSKEGEKAKDAVAAPPASKERYTEPKVEYIRLQDGLNGPW